jgi:electron transfer flavoprotein alpha subunit
MAVLLLAEVQDGELSLDATAKAVSGAKALPLSL